SMSHSRSVYSTEHGRLCPGCGQAQAACDCRARAQARPAGGDGIVRVGRATKGRAGKGVTVISGLPLAAAELQALAKTLKQHCGTGGTVRDAVIEIQGEQRDRLVDLLQKMGYKVRKSGA